MTEHINLIYLLRKCFEKDRICIYYHGDFDDIFTDKLITLAKYDVTKKARKRMAFLMSESFQILLFSIKQQAVFQNEPNRRSKCPPRKNHITGTTRNMRMIGVGQPHHYQKRPKIFSYLRLCPRIHETTISGFGKFSFPNINKSFT